MLNIRDLKIDNASLGQKMLLVDAHVSNGLTWAVADGMLWLRVPLAA